jgi:hypothetical protein
MPKYTHTHKTAGGLARVVCTDKVGEYNYVVLYIYPKTTGETVASYTKEEFETEFKELPPWHDCKIDDPVYVRMPGVESWLKRHFAGVDAERNPLFWVDGCTSFTSCGAIFRELAAECYPADQAPEHVVQCSVT